MMKFRKQRNKTAVALSFVVAATGIVSAQEEEPSLGQTSPAYGAASIHSTPPPSPTLQTTQPPYQSEASREDYEPTTIASGGQVSTTGSGLFDAGLTGGTRVGTGNFEGRPWGISLTVNQGWDDNIYATHNNKQDSFFTGVSLGGYFGLSNGRTTLRLSSNIGGIYYWDRSGNDVDPDMNLTLSFSHAISEKWSLSIVGYVAYQAEANYQTVFASTRPGQDYVYGSLQFQLSQRWSRRFSTVYGYTVGGVVYTDDANANVNPGQSGLDQTFSLQLQYLVKPLVTLVAEYRFGIAAYDDSGGDSTYNYLLAGFDVTVSQRLSASLRTGAEIRNSDDGGEDGAIPFVEASLSYRFAKHSSLVWVNRYGYEQPSNTGPIADVRKTYRTGLVINHDFTPRIRAQLGGYYTTSDYDNGFGTEDTLDLNFNISYGILPYLSLQAGYTFTEVWSDFQPDEYDRNRIYGGVTFSF